ncbi:unnamed protein product [Sphagnum tenellum]
MSISYSTIKVNKKDELNHTLHVPPFVVTSKSAKMVFLNAGLFEEMPTDPICKVYDYTKGDLVGDREFLKLHASALQYSPSGKLISCGFTNGILKLIHSDNFADIQSFSYTRLCINQVMFSRNANYLASGDASFCVALLHLQFDADGDRWICTGKYRSHAATVTGVHFTEDSEGLTRLFSIGQDTMLVEYNVQESTVASGLKLKGQYPLNNLTPPTSISSYLTFFGELHLVICDGGFKVRIYDTIRFVCHKTFLGPAFGMPIFHMHCIRNHLAKEYMVFATQEQVIGIMSTPNGNKKNLQMLGLVAHPGVISSVAVSYDGKVILSISGLDRLTSLLHPCSPLSYSFSMAFASSSSISELGFSTKVSGLGLDLTVLVVFLSSHWDPFLIYT